MMDEDFGDAEYRPPEHPMATSAGDMWASGSIIHWLCLQEPPLNADCGDDDDAFVDKDARE